DLELMEWMAERQLPFVLVFTKSDKLGATNLEKAIAVYKEQLLLNWEELPEMIITSSEKARGRDELLDYIQSNNQLFKAIQAQ
ncbi:MAG TPA: YihA family ribosome biogenesis GTP-binding protein, partial [Bacteroidales bacterium]|nr:YihA family ribosome biogenesis GTP-binding protein [Bacteroidales bacterium]